MMTIEVNVDKLREMKVQYPGLAPMLDEIESKAAGVKAYLDELQ
jgi:hypothetical protein